MFNFSFFIFSITLLFLIFASFYDVKKRIVPNFLVISLLGIGLITKIIQAIYFSSFSIILNSLISFILTLVVGYILWEVGFFAGGDLKLFAAIALFNPFNLNFLGFMFSLNVISLPIFALTLIIVSILCTAPVLLINSIYLFIFKGHYKIRIIIFKTKNTLFSLISSVLVIFLISSFFNIFSMDVPFILYFVFSIIFILFFRKIETRNLTQYYFLLSFFYFLLIFYSMVFSKTVFYFKNLITIIITLVIIFLAVAFYKIIYSKILITSKKVYSLKEGDVVLNNYYLSGTKVIEKRVSFIQYLKNFTSPISKHKLMVDSRKAGGLLNEDITFLKSCYKHNLEKEILLKKTIPFTPSVLIAYILLNILGDFIWFFL